MRTWRRWWNPANSQCMFPRILQAHSTSTFYKHSLQAQSTSTVYKHSLQVQSTSIWSSFLTYVCLCCLVSALILRHVTQPGLWWLVACSPGWLCTVLTRLKYREHAHVPHSKKHSCKYWTRKSCSCKLQIDTSASHFSLTFDVWIVELSVLKCLFFSSVISSNDCLLNIENKHTLACKRWWIFF